MQMRDRRGVVPELGQDCVGVLAQRGHRAEGRLQAELTTGGSRVGIAPTGESICDQRFLCTSCGWSTTSVTVLTRAQAIPAPTSRSMAASMSRSATIGAIAASSSSAVQDALRVAGEARVLSQLWSAEHHARHPPPLPVVLHADDQPLPVPGEVGVVRRNGRVTEPAPEHRGLRRASPRYGVPHPFGDGVEHGDVEPPRPVADRPTSAARIDEYAYIPPAMSPTAIPGLTGSSKASGDGGHRRLGLDQQVVGRRSANGPSVP